LTSCSAWEGALTTYPYKLRPNICVLRRAPSAPPGVYPLATLMRFTADILRYAVTLTFDFFLLNVCNISPVTCSFV